MLCCDICTTQGTCGKPDSPDFGIGRNTFTSGFEGAWTVEPTVWDNEYFKDLLEYNWEKEIGPGGHYQWRPVLKPESTEREDEIPDIFMLTTDVALLYVRLHSLRYNLSTDYSIVKSYQMESLW